MKIIVHGKKPAKTAAVYRMRCTHCACIFEFTQDEMDSVIKGIKINDIGFITCPECGANLLVTQTHWVRTEVVEDDKN